LAWSGGSSWALQASAIGAGHNFLPGEHREVQARPAGFLAASARENAQHHADAETVPPGRLLRDAAAAQDHHGAAAAAAGDGVDVDDVEAVGRLPQRSRRRSSKSSVVAAAVFM